MLDKNSISRAMDDLEPGNVYFIDRRTQKITLYTLKDLAGLEALKKSIQAEPDRFTQIPKPQPADNLRELEAFIAVIQDPKLKEALKRTLTSHRPFREFRDLLATKVKEKREWEVFHKKTLEQRVERFLKSTGLVK